MNLRNPPYPQINNIVRKIFVPGIGNPLINAIGIISKRSWDAVYKWNPDFFIRHKSNAPANETAYKNALRKKNILPADNINLINSRFCSSGIIERLLEKKP